MSKDMYLHRPLVWLSTEADRRRGSKTTLRNESGELKKLLQDFKLNCSLDCLTSPLKQKLTAATSYCGSRALRLSITPGGGGNCNFTPSGCHKRLTVASPVVGYSVTADPSGLGPLTQGLNAPPFAKYNTRGLFLPHCPSAIVDSLSGLMFSILLLTQQGLGNGRFGITAQYKSVSKSGAEWADRWERLI